MDISLLKKLDFSDKQIAVYCTLLRLGPASIRHIAEESGVNRGSVYDTLKWLESEGLVTRYAEKKRNYYSPEPPQALIKLAEKRKVYMNKVIQNLEEDLPAWQAMYNKHGAQPVARYYADGGVRHILEDVLESCEKSSEKLYRIYSSDAVREYIYDDFPEFSEERIKAGISVKVIAIGDGGELRGLDERKWLQSNTETPTYIIIYSNKTAYISLDSLGKPIGVVIANTGIYETQKMLFDQLWERL